MTPTDLMFLFSESRGHPANMGLLFLLDPPVGAGPEFVREFYDALVANDEFQPTFRKHPATIGGGIAQLAWAYDEHIDVDHHVRLSALPASARVRDLFELSSRLHASSFDRDRPLWELHVLEGLADGRFAMYVKLHHILFDGVALLNLVRRTYSVDPSDLGMRAMWSLPWLSDQQSDLPSRPASLGKRVGSIAGLALSTVKLARAALIEQQLTMPFEAPPSMFNVKIGQARQYAAQSWALERIMRVKQAAGVTVNDAVLAMCAGALRYYLIEQEALPDAPLIALVPVSLRQKEGADAGGNMVGSILCNLATHLEDACEQKCAGRPATGAGAGVVCDDHGGAAGSVGFPGRNAAAVQPCHLECAGPSRTDVLPGGSGRRRLSAVVRHGRASPKHHHGEQFGQSRFWLDRLSARCAVSAPAAWAPGIFAQGPGAGCRGLKDYPQADIGALSMSAPVQSALICWAGLPRSRGGRVSSQLYC